MRNIFRLFAFMAIVAVSVVGCQVIDDEYDIVEPQGNGTVLYASMANDNLSKLDFTDNGSNGVAIDWEVGDVFAVFTSDPSVMFMFTCTDAEKGEFTSDDDLVDGESYVACYSPYFGDSVSSLDDDDSLVNDNDNIDNLAAEWTMQASFIYSEDEPESELIKFEHECAIMTIKFKSDVTPSMLQFIDGEVDYYSFFQSATPTEDGFYIAHIAIYPTEAEERTLLFKVYTDNDNGDSRKVSAVYQAVTSKEYVVGYRYTANTENYTKVDVEWSGEGSGTEGDPYKVSSIEDLQEMARVVNIGIAFNGEYFKLMNDIELNGSEENKWTPIGLSTSVPFSGLFDGCDNKITGLYVNSGIGESGGLFGAVNSAEISNLTVSGTVKGSDDPAGGIVGYASYSTIKDCSNEASVSGYESVGGVVGYVNGASTISGCSNSGAVVGTKSVGGVVGGFALNASSSTESMIISCFNTATVTGTQGPVGGVAGAVDAQFDTQISLCYNSGVVTSEDCEVGGVIGNLTIASNCKLNFEKCYNIAEVSGVGQVGGVVGVVWPSSGSDATISSCYNKGSIKGSTGQYIGGVIGEQTFSFSKFYNCYNRGDVSGYLHVGGVIGISGGDSYPNANLYNTGVVSCSAGGSVGGVAGYAYYNRYLSYSYYSTDCCSVGIGGTQSSSAPSEIQLAAKSEAEMKDAAFVQLLNTNSEGWQEDTSSINDGYPIFSWQVE